MADIIGIDRRANKENKTYKKRANSLECFREEIERIPEKLGERQYIFKVGMAYGFWNNKRKGPLKFYFEVKDEYEMIKSRRTDREGD